MSLLEASSALSPVEKDKKVIISKTAGLLRYIRGSHQKLSTTDFNALLNTFWEAYDELGDAIEQMEDDRRTSEASA